MALFRNRAARLREENDRLRHALDDSYDRECGLRLERAVLRGTVSTYRPLLVRAQEERNAYRDEVNRLRQERDDLVEELTRERARREEQREDGEGTLAGMTTRPFLIPAEEVSRLARALIAGWELAKDSTAPYGPGWALDFARHYRDFCALVSLNPAPSVLEWLEAQCTCPPGDRPEDLTYADRPDHEPDHEPEGSRDLCDPEPETEQTIDGPVWEWVSDPAELKAGDRIRWERFTRDVDAGPISREREDRECVLENTAFQGEEERRLIDPHGRYYVVFRDRWSKWVAGGGVHRLVRNDAG